MSNLNMNSFSLREFVSQVKENESAGDASEFLRSIQRASFNLLWSRCDQTVMRMYQNIGKATQALFSSGESFSKVRERIALKPQVGMIRSTMSFHDDTRYILVVSGKTLFLIFDNHATDFRLHQIWVYNPEEDVEGFVEYEDVQGGKDLMDFLLTRSLKL